MSHLPHLTPRDERPDVPPLEPTRSIAGVSGLVLGLMAAICIPLGCPTWGLAWFAVGPLALLGLAFSLAARGRLRAVGVTLGATLTALGAGYWLLIITQWHK